MDQVLIENLDTTALMEKMQEMLQNVKDVIMKLWNKVKSIFFSFMNYLKAEDKEYVRLLNISKRVKSKRLKKKTRKRLLLYINKYLS